MIPSLKLHKIKFTVGGVLLGSVLLFGFRGTFHRLTAGLDEAREFINDSTSVDELVKVGRKQIADAGERLFDAESAAKTYRQQEERVKAEIAQLQLAAATGRSRLETLRLAISSNSGYQQASCHYSAADVRQDAVQLATFVKGCDEQATLKQEELKDLEQTLSSGDATLLDAHKEFAQAQMRFQALSIRLKQQQAIVTATSAARAARDGLSTDLGGEFADTIAALEKRLNKLQRQNDGLRTSESGVPAGNIPFGPAAGADAETLVNEVLGTAAKTAPLTVQSN